MRLEAIDGTIVELNATGYQFPLGYDLPSGRHVEPDWLNVEGGVTANGREWKWSFPCLYSDEAVALGAWLDSLTRREPVAARIGFTEPNIAIDVVELSEDHAALRFAFAQEACPPGEPDDVRLGDGYSVDATFSHDALTAAVEAWRAEIAPFPARE